jgi:iron(III) transport system substrate-binding protein
MKRLIIWLSLAMTSFPLCAAEPLVIFSGRSDKFVKPVIEAFTRDSGIEVVLHSAKSTELLNKLRLEGARTDADLFLSNDAGNLQKGSELGLFRPIPDAIAGVIDSRLRASDNSWVGLSARARVLVVNTTADELDFVTSVFDLANPMLKGSLGITNSANESFIAGTTVYMLKAGKDDTTDWLQGLKANAGDQVYAKHSKVVADVAAGRKTIGLVNHYYIYRHLAKHPDAPIEIRLPDQGEDQIGVAWNVAGIAISAHSDNPAAVKLVEYLLSEAGQKMFAEENSEYPTRGGVPAASMVPPAGSYKVADVPMADLGKYRDATLDLLESTGMP